MDMSRCYSCITGSQEPELRALFKASEGGNPFAPVKKHVPFAWLRTGLGSKMNLSQQPRSS